MVGAVRRIAADQQDALTHGRPASGTSEVEVPRHIVRSDGRGTPGSRRALLHAERLAASRGRARGGARVKIRSRRSSSRSSVSDERRRPEAARAEVVAELPKRSCGEVHSLREFATALSQSHSSRSRARASDLAELAGAASFSGGSSPIDSASTVERPVPLASADAGRIEHVLVDLIDAVEMMGDQGIVTLRSPPAPPRMEPGHAGIWTTEPASTRPRWSQQRTRFRHQSNQERPRPHARPADRGTGAEFGVGSRLHVGTHPWLDDSHFGAAEASA